MKKILLMLALLPWTAFGQSNNVQKYIDEVLRRDSVFLSSATAILAVDAEGRDVASWNPDMSLMTASTMKTITTAVALDVLGPDFRFETKVGYSGEIDSEGMLHGDVFIIGGGDPTLASRDTLAADIDSLFAVWTESLMAAGISAVEGKVIGDNRLFKEEAIPIDWSWNNIGWAFGSGPSALSFCENSTFCKVVPGRTVGAPLTIVPLEPYIPDMLYLNEATTGAPHTGDNLEYVVSDLAPVGRFSGTYAIDRPLDTISISNKYPSATCASYFSRFLDDSGISNGGSACVDEISGCGTADSVTCVTYSPSLLEIINVTNRASNNFYAETLLKMTGLKLGGDSTYKSALKLVKEYISGKGCHTWGFTQDDGSGLSRQNYVSPRFFCRFYGTMMKSGNFDLFFSTLPIPGQDGTMKNVLAAEPWSVRSRIHAKSGSLSNVRCYTGFVKCADGTLLRFAIMVNNHPGTSRTVQPKIEAFLKELSHYASQQGVNATN